MLLLIIVIILLVFLIFIRLCDHNKNEIKKFDWNWVYISRNEKLPGNPPFKRIKYVNDQLLNKAIKEYYEWLRMWDEFRYMWE